MIKERKKKKRSVFFVALKERSDDQINMREKKMKCSNGEGLRLNDEYVFFFFSLTRVLRFAEGTLFLSRDLSLSLYLQLKSRTKVGIYCAYLVLKLK